MIPATQAFISDTSGTLAFDYNNSTGSGNTVTYEHKLAESGCCPSYFVAQIKCHVDAGCFGDPGFYLRCVANFSVIALDQRIRTSVSVSCPPG